ncbi:MAG: Guanine nucleotide exchange factor lte1 [Phylliscum demangeonii]|nr:MAG: Guanine nucleotide exchange factor lte1 [Phylliscum demangeonii]
MDALTRAKSLSSELSAPVLSCSIPAPGFRRAVRALHSAHGIPPVALAPPPRPSPAVTQAATPRPHQRSGSFSDALRDRRVPLPQPKGDGPTPAPPVRMVVPFAGSLIRGDHLPPPSAVVRELAPRSPVTERAFHLSALGTSADALAHAHRTGATYGPGMRKLFGSVRRVWHHRDGDEHDGADRVGPAHASPSTARPPGSGRLPATTTAAPDATVIRVDFLAAQIAEDFPTAVRHAPGVEARDPAALVRGMAVRSDASDFVNVSWPTDAATDATPSALVPGTARGVSGVTEGSTSIVIVDDTRPPVPPVWLGLLPPTEPGPAAADRVTSRTAVRPHAPRSPQTPGPAPVAAAGHGPRRRSSSAEVSMRTASVARASPAVDGSGRLPGRWAQARVSSSLRRSSSFPSPMADAATVVSFDATSGTTASDGDPAAAGSLSRPPARLLRRRPGGDLRAAEKVADLRHTSWIASIGPLRRRSRSVPRSRTQTLVSAVTSLTVDRDRDRGDVVRRRFSLGALAEAGDGPALSLIQTHSSQPNLRPSFESEVARLAQLPDDDEDGGIESTLLKLEGKFERRPSEEEAVVTGDDAHGRASGTHGAPPRWLVDSVPGQLSVETTHPGATRSSGDGAALSLGDETDPDPDPDERPYPAPAPCDATAHAIVTVTTSVVESEDSYSSTPLLERGLSTKSFRGTRSGRSPSTLSLPPRSYVPRHRRRSTAEAGPCVPPDVVEEDTSSGRQTLTASHAARDSTTQPSILSQGSFLLDDHDDPPDSFLLDDDEDLSDLSSELTDATVHTPDRAHFPSDFPSGTFPTVTSGTVISEIGVPFHPLRHPPSPPPTSGGHAARMPAVDRPGAAAMDPPPTPDLSVDERIYAGAFGRGGGALAPRRAPELRPDGLDGHVAGRRRPGAEHLPFILGHESSLLAQQFTLLEKDALQEIDWKELVELRPASKPSELETRNWQHFLQRGRDTRGVDLVIARFNMVVKWTLSEIVLTQDVAERARTISKCIHVAAQARRLRNYATMYQITTALLSVDCSRLKETWKRVPAPDLQMVDELEALVQPLRNFHQLRVEMETATVEEGCIPFLGIYIHDLAFNSQRPSWVDDGGRSREGTMRLINFEKYRTTAAVVKSLLRLLEASSKYDFGPVRGVTERCLWLTALSDEEIRRRSKALE